MQECNLGLLLNFLSRNLSKTVLILAYFLTFVLKVQYSSTLHKYGVEFHQEFNGIGPRHVTCVFHVSDTFFFFHFGIKEFPTLVLNDLQTSMG